MKPTLGKLSAQMGPHISANQSQWSVPLLTTLVGVTGAITE